MALIRVAFWLQMNRRFGPVVININRVVLDIVTITCSYLVMLMAYSLGILFVLTVHTYPYNAPNSSNETRINGDTEEPIAFTEILNMMLWAALNPGPP